MKLREIITLTFFLIISLTVSAQNEKDADKKYKVRAVAEIGYLGVLGHNVQFGQNGTYFDYKRDGGQDVLFPVNRMSLEFEWNERNTLVFLYQPLKIESQVLLNEDLIVDDLVFPASSSVNLLYNFPFYRVSYLRELIKNPDKFKFAIGGTLQLRNATITFESTDGSKFRTNRDLGPVPALKIRSKLELNKNVYMELESDGIYAPVSYLNGSDTEIVGAILDASLRTGVKLSEPVKSFINLRYLGGGAVGTSNDNKGPGDGYVKNWLNFGTVTIGFEYDF
ncbi:hypothetical protein SAMN06298216_3408 [Spirosomataceae bacterium TFI 002]|nr:hypothetical protein SAMN06298216_3408 [Spirosomataceae bacterium TFI 002]